MHAFLRFAGFRKKALTLSYDDGMIFDRRLMEILDKNGIKCTFNLNSGTYGDPRRFSREEAVALYKNSPHEIACHGEHHISLSEVDRATATRDILLDRQDHERTYARTTHQTERFDSPTDWLRLPTTCHHANPRLLELLDKFLEEPKEGSSWKQHCPRLFYLWGHSYEFNDADNWEIIENFARLAGGHDSVWYATNIEIYDYVKAYESLVYNVDATLVHNPSATDVWLSYYGHDVFVGAGQTASIPKLWD